MWLSFIRLIYATSNLRDAINSAPSCTRVNCTRVNTDTLVVNTTKDAAQLSQYSDYAVGSIPCRANDFFQKRPELLYSSR
jgi:hypothetical protein